MKKTLIALALFGTAAGIAYAQSNVTIYGVMDTGYVKKTGKDLGMDQNNDSKIGFRGIEDLGGGMKATFQLEKRFDVNDGKNHSSAGKDWEGAANVGLKSDSWGAIRLGRLNGIATENIRKFDPFYQYGVGKMIDSTQRATRQDNMLRYDSLNYGGFSFSASYTLGQNMNSKSRTKYADGNKYLLDDTNHSRGYDNDGYALGLNYKNGGFAATANYQVTADSNRSSMWNVGLSYSFDTVKLEALYQATKDRGGLEAAGTKAWDSKKEIYNSLSEQQALLGIEWKLGQGRLNASAQWLGVEGKGTSNLDSDAFRYAVGYTYNLSKRTSLYGIVSYTDWDDKSVGKIFDKIEQDSCTGVQLGITHKF